MVVIGRPFTPPHSNLMSHSVIHIALGSTITLIVSLGRLLMNHKYPRTLSEAFGPYTSNEIYDDSPAETWTFWLAVSVTILLAILIIGLLIC